MNKPDWKSISKSPGYKSLKATYINDKSRDKEEKRKLFKFVIDRALHTSVRTSIPVEEILNQWEEDRNYWWFNYYQSSRIPKIPKGKPYKPRNFLKPNPDYYKKLKPRDRLHEMRRLRRVAPQLSL